MLSLLRRRQSENGTKPHTVPVDLMRKVRRIEITTKRLVNEEVAGGYVYVDGLGVGDIGNVVLRDRHHLARDGFVVVVVAINQRTGELTGDPEILTRGFVYLPESEDLIEGMREHVANLVKETHGAHDVLINRLPDALGQYVYGRTKRRPMVIPLVVEV